MFIALGDGLPAGFGPWRLSAAGRRTSFPARLARRLGVPFVLPPSDGQDVLRAVAGGRDSNVSHHLAVPGLDFGNFLERRASTPLLRDDDALATEINLTLAYPHLVRPGLRPPNLLEAAALVRPTHVLVSLGFDRALEAVRAGDVSLLSSSREITATLDRLSTVLVDASFAVTAVLAPKISIGVSKAGAAVAEAVAGQNDTLRRWAAQAGAVFIDWAGADGLEAPEAYGVDG
ncbi:MAG: hypothetical protein AAGM22_18180, partial [Acidobacteriota bacterium]